MRILIKDYEELPLVLNLSSVEYDKLYNILYLTSVNDNDYSIHDVSFTLYETVCIDLTTTGYTTRLKTFIAHKI